MVVDVQIACQADDLPSTEALQTIGACALAACERADGEVCVRIVDGAEIRDLNHRFRNQNKETNVLSFPADLPVDSLPLLGDVVICAPVVSSEAAEQGKPVQHHYAHMLVHGILHLCGHDHEKDQDAEVMETLEADVLASLDIENPYNWTGR